MLAAGVALVLAACAGRVPEPAAPPVPPPAGEAEVSGSRAVLALAADADALHRQGDLAEASAKLERAVRLEPRNAELWHRLAAIRLDQGRPEDAESLALKSISLTGSHTLITQNWRLIADARRAAGDTEGARRAEDRVLVRDAGDASASP